MFERTRCVYGSGSAEIEKESAIGQFYDWLRKASRKPLRTGRSLEEFGGVWGVRRSLEEFGGVRRSLGSSEEFGGVRRSSGRALGSPCDTHMKKERSPFVLWFIRIRISIFLWYGDGDGDGGASLYGR